MNIIVMYHFVFSIKYIHVFFLFVFIFVYIFDTVYRSTIHHIISYYTILYYIVLYHIITCHIISYYIISYYIILYHIISYHIILWTYLIYNTKWYMSMIFMMIMIPRYYLLQKWGIKASSSRKWSKLRKFFITCIALIAWYASNSTSWTDIYHISSHSSSHMWQYCKDYKRGK